MKTLMLGGEMPGGLITEALDVENYPGHISTIADLHKFYVKTPVGEYVGKSVILSF